MELSHLVEEQEGCTQWHFIDDSDWTGVHNEDVTEATITILPYGSTVGYLFTFTITSNIISDLTVTAPNGTITNIFSTLTDYTYPFTVTEPFVIIGEWLGFGVDSELQSSVYNFLYTAYVDPFTYVSTSDEVIVCQVCCCVNNAAASLEATDCDCQTNNLNTAVNSRIFLDSSIWAMENGDPDKSYANLMFAKSLCEGKCKTC